MVQLAVVGDVHGAWDDGDAPALDACGYDLIIVVGDLGGFRHGGTLEVARGLSALRTRALWVPGNHDASHPAQLLAEVLGRSTWGDPLALGQSRRLGELAAAAAPVEVAAYSLHRVGSLTVLAGRPHSMGGPKMAFPRHLAEGWGVRSLEESKAKMLALLEQVDTEDVLFAAHNGPTGLGDRRTDLWGNDFQAAQGDWGDPDLRVAIDAARARGLRVTAVVAGHMHRSLRGGGERRWHALEDGIRFVNAAEVPRHREGRRHHVHVSIGADGTVVEDRWL